MSTTNQTESSKVIETPPTEQTTTTNTTTQETITQEKSTSETKINLEPFMPRMDDANKKAAQVLQNQGTKAFIEHVFTDQDTGRKLSYAEMRMRYG
tara:strand:- start:151 stop:438 length:288 start_codon:yes stop_codon:yes gene_type:complete